MTQVCATCGFPWGLSPLRHSDMCDDRRLADADDAVAGMMTQTDKEILALATPAEIEAAMSLAKDIARYNERMDIVAFLRRGGEDVRGLWVSWDSETRSYAQHFADRIACEDHRLGSPESAA